MDTSVWIRVGRGREPFCSVNQALVRRQEALGHPLVYGELLIGDRGGRQALLTDYRRYAWAEMMPHEAVVTMVHARQLQGRGISWVDAHLLASAMAGRHRLWTADEALAAVARELGVGWTPR